MLTVVLSTHTQNTLTLSVVLVTAVPLFIRTRIDRIHQT